LSCIPAAGTLRWCFGIFPLITRPAPAARWRVFGADRMAVNRRIEVTNFSGSAGEVTMVRFLDRKIIDAANIQELGDELFGLVEKEQRKNLLLNFANVEFLSSAALNKLIILDKKVKAHTGKMRLCNLKPEIYEVFAITRLNQLFDIKNTEAEALAGF
jgi:anti-sigma B factor antagonist